MKQFLQIKEPEELDFYSIRINYQGKKEIHVHGFSYFGDHWVMADVCWFIEELASFIERLKDDAGYVELMYSELNQYHQDCSPDEMTESINTYFNGESADYYLPFSEITLETPCGKYVSQICA